MKQLEMLYEGKAKQVFLTDDPEKIILSVIGPVIGSHSGPGTVALFFRGKHR